jgi:hypothetical protein
LQCFPDFIRSTAFRPVVLASADSALIVVEPAHAVRHGPSQCGVHGLLGEQNARRSRMYGGECCRYLAAPREEVASSSAVSRADDKPRFATAWFEACRLLQPHRAARQHWAERISCKAYQANA